MEVCPKKAVHMEGGRSHIDEDACIKCGKCLEACPYNAIIKQERPCSKACGMNAIGSDEYGRAEIDQDKCVSCGQCLVSCPFSAIVDKGQIFQTIMALKSETPVYASWRLPLQASFRVWRIIRYGEHFRHLALQM